MNRHRESGADNGNLVSPLGGTFVPGQTDTKMELTLPHHGTDENVSPSWLTSKVSFNAPSATLHVFQRLPDLAQ